jgi:SAM-dependent methyltransferase
MSGNPLAWFGVSLRRRQLDADLQALAAGLTGRGLEIGSGRILRRGGFQPPPAAHWVSLDIARRPQPDIVGDVQRLPVAAASFDAIVCSEVLEYIPRLGEAVAEMGRALKPGGRLVIAAPFLHRADTPGDLWRFTEAGLRRLLNEGGFEVVEIRAQGAALGVAANILRFAITSIPNRALRLAASAAAYLPLRTLAALDRAAARRLPALASFSTGHAASAVKR